MSKIDPRALPSALPPSTAELGSWQELSRDEQIASYRQALQAPDTERVSKATVADVLSAARQRVGARRG